MLMRAACCIGYPGINPTAAQCQVLYSLLMASRFHIPDLELLGKSMRRLVFLSLLAAATLQQPSLSKDEFGEKHVRGEESFPQAFESLRKTSEPQKDTPISTEDDPPLDIHKSDPAVHVALSKKYTKEKKYREALIEVNRALLCNKNDWDAQFQGALILQLEGRTKEAIDRYKRYLVVKPDNLQAHINLGVLLRKEGEMVEAEDEYKKAIELHYYSLQPHYNLANLYIETHKFEDALKELRVCVKLAPTNAWVHNNLGVVFQQREYYEEAEEEFLKALNLEPANKTFETNLASIRQYLRKKPIKA
jgi:Flp pilus assembly protein TadD